MSEKVRNCMNCKFFETWLDGICDDCMAYPSYPTIMKKHKFKEIRI